MAHRISKQKDTLSVHLAVLVSERMRRAIELAARQQCTTASAYTRQAIIERMRADGVEPTQAEAT